MSVRILCTGDVHLGRRPGRVPPSIADDSLTPAAVWNRFVDIAIEREVDLVALTGDIVDKGNKYFEAYPLLKSGVEKLIRNGIDVFAVAGNHDYDVLKGLADQIPGFQLLGRNSQWQEVHFKRDGKPVARLIGWSFPTGHVSTSPLCDFSPPDRDLPTIGMLHCDCDASKSPYAPVSLDDLKSKSPVPDVWLLGHIHKPDILCKRPLILYPGSPQGLDPGESGKHGAWLITVESGQSSQAEFLPLAGLRWEQVDVLLEGVSDVRSAVIKAIKATLEQISNQLEGVKTVGCRLSLKGRTLLYRQLGGLIEEMSDFTDTCGDIEYFVEKVRNLSRPDVSLEELSREKHPVGLLARRLLILDTRQPADEYNELIRQGGGAIEQQKEGVYFSSLADNAEPLEESQVRETLQAAGWSILDNLLSQKGDAS